MRNEQVHLAQESTQSHNLFASLLIESGVNSEPMPTGGSPAEHFALACIGLIEDVPLTESNTYYSFSGGSQGNSSYGESGYAGRLQQRRVR